MVLPDASIDHADDVGMVEQGENASLGNESALSLGSEQPAGHQLDGDFTLELAVVTPGAVDDAHAALADARQKPIGSNGLAFGQVHFAGDVQKASGRIMGGN